MFKKFLNLFTRPTIEINSQWILERQSPFLPTLHYKVIDIRDGWVRLVNFESEKEYDVAISMLTKVWTKVK